MASTVIFKELMKEDAGTFKHSDCKYSEPALLPLLKETELTKKIKMNSLQKLSILKEKRKETVKVKIVIQ